MKSNKSYGSGHSAKKTDWGLKFYLDVLKLRSLHFGLWEGDPLTLKGMRSAQERYTEQLLNLIPEGVKTVLDAGCGTGTTAEKLKSRGYEVECLNPDKYQENLFKEKFHNTIPFHPVKFEEFTSTAPKKYDLILMSESSQYMDTVKMAEKAKSILSPGGWLLIADYFRKEDTTFYKTCRMKDEFLRKIKSAGFDLVEEKDITEKVIPTLTMGKKIYDEYALPTIEILSGYFRENQPFLTGLVSKLFSKKLKKISGYLYIHTPEKLNETEFTKNMEYLFLLLRRTR